MKKAFEKSIIIAFILFGVGAFATVCVQGCKDRAKPQKTPEVVTAPVPDNHFCATIAPIDRPPQAVGVRNKFWKSGQEVKVKFMGGTDAQKQYVLSALMQWGEVVNLSFPIVTTKSDWRISFTNSGSWSYIGTDCSSIPASQATMNIGWSGVDVCLHEIGHALGMAHEQANPNGGICWNKPIVYAALAAPPNNWSKSMVDSNVFYKYDTAQVFTTPFDGVSIMEYSIPDSWVCSGHGYPGGKVISATDRAFMSGIYPKAIPPQTRVSITRAQADTIRAWLK